MTTQTAIGVLFLVCSLVTLWLFLRSRTNWRHPLLVVPIVSACMILVGKTQSQDPVEHSIYESIHQRAERILHGQENQATTRTAEPNRVAAE